MSSTVVTNIPQGSISQVYYLVALGYKLIDRPGTADDVTYLDILGNYEDLEDAKRSVEANAHLIMDNDNQYLNLYKVDLEQCKMFSFYRKNLQDPIAKALKEQKMADAKAAERTRRELEEAVVGNKYKKPEGQPWLFHSTKM